MKIKKKIKNKEKGLFKIYLQVEMKNQQRNQWAKGCEKSGKLEYEEIFAEKNLNHTE